ncbi:MAG: hypothetical protein U9N86_02740 [Bacteroidota bacterium]|nr:hypothetical protein [Bacteroidota bacterium]
METKKITALIFAASMLILTGCENLFKWVGSIAPHKEVIIPQAGCIQMIRKLIIDIHLVQFSSIIQV